MDSAIPQGLPLLRIDGESLWAHSHDADDERNSGLDANTSIFVPPTTYPALRCLAQGVQEVALLPLEHTPAYIDALGILIFAVAVPYQAMGPISRSLVHHQSRPAVPWILNK
jgi:hypothetical protein